MPSGDSRCPGDGPLPVRANARSFLQIKEASSKQGGQLLWETGCAGQSYPFQQVNKRRVRTFDGPDAREIFSIPNAARRLERKREGAPTLHPDALRTIVGRQFVGMNRLRMKRSGASFVECLA
jgi:hypothetical protein